MNKLCQKIQNAAKTSGQDYLGDLFVYLYINKKKLEGEHAPEEIRQNPNLANIINRICDLMFEVGMKVIIDAGENELSEKEISLIAKGYIKQTERI